MDVLLHFNKADTPTYCHDEVLMYLISDIQLHCGDAVVYSDIDGFRATDAQ